MSASSLTANQMSNLSWVQADCPPLDPEGEVSRRSVVASLRKRGLVEVTGGGPTWLATITSRGEALLRGESPAPPPPEPFVPRDRESWKQIDRRVLPPTLEDGDGPDDNSGFLQGTPLSRSRRATSSLGQRAAGDRVVMEFALALTTEEAARVCGVGRKTIDSALHRGELVGSYATSRPVFTVENLMRWLDALPTEKP